MIWLFRVLLLAALMVPAVATAQVADPCAVRGGITSPIALVSVNGECINLTDFIAPVTDKTFLLTVNDLVIPDVAVIDATALFNVDPFITFGATTTNLVAGETTFAFLFGTPIVPGLYNTASSTGGVSVTSGPLNAVTVDNSAIFGTYISAYGTVGSAPTNLGVDLGTEPCTAPAPLSTDTCTQGSTSTTFAPTFYDNLEALLTYTQSGVATVASWSGGVTLDFTREDTSVPEPMTVTLLAVSAFALGAVGIARRRRR